MDHRLIVPGLHHTVGSEAWALLPSISHSIHLPEHQWSHSGQSDRSLWCFAGKLLFGFEVVPWISVSFSHFSVPVATNPSLIFTSMHHTNEDKCSGLKLLCSLIPKLRCPKRSTLTCKLHLLETCSANFNVLLSYKDSLSLSLSRLVLLSCKVLKFPALCFPWIVSREIILSYFGNQSHMSSFNMSDKSPDHDSQFLVPIISEVLKQLF